MKKLLSMLVILTMTITVWAIEPVQPTVGNGSSANPYQIGSAGNLIWLAQQVKAGAQNQHAKLIADIDLGDDQTMIGTSDHRYNGIFDGNNHTITVNYTATENRTALFRYVTWATIKNLRTAGSISTGYTYAAGIMADGFGTINITNCVSSIAITSTFTEEKPGSHGGIVGFWEMNSETSERLNLKNVVFNGKMLGANATACGGLVGYTRYARVENSLFCPSEMTFSYKDGAYTIVGPQSYVGLGVTVINSYYTTLLGHDQGTAITAQAIASGDACYMFNKGYTDGTQIWYQNLDNGEIQDVSPIPFKNHGTVYGGPDQCPLNTFSNTKKYHSGSNTDGLGTRCSNPECSCTQFYQHATLVDGSYQIANKGNLLWFAQKNNNGVTNLKGKLTADIDMGDDQTMIGTSTNRYNSIFDGDGHTITLNYTATEDNTALFRYTNNSTIKNLKTAGSITTNYQYAGGIVSECDGTTNIDNCVSSVAITSTFDETKDGVHGGIVAHNQDEVNLTHVVFCGKLLGGNATACGGFVGLSDESTNVVNSLFCPSQVTFGASGASTLSNGNITVTNSYYSVLLGGPQGTATTPEAVASGEVCYKLNRGKTDGTQGWYQNIDNGETPDTIPLYDKNHATVYGGLDQCTVGTYSNTPKAHTFGEYGEDGLSYCTISGCTGIGYQPAEQDNSGNYLISNKGNLTWFAHQVNDGRTSINGKLTTNINLDDDMTMIGNNENKYSGTFDGDGYSITVNYLAKENVAALFRYIGTATIKNLMTSGNIKAWGKQVAGVVGLAQNLTLKNVISNVSISSIYTGDSSDGGLVAGISSKATITNCAFIGKLLGPKTSHCGGLIGWTEDAQVSINNCYVYLAEQTVSTTGCKTLARYRRTSPTFKNCYYIDALGDAQGTQVEVSAVADGTLVDKLGASVWMQDPVLHTPVPFKIKRTIGVTLDKAMLVNALNNINGNYTLTFAYSAPEGATEGAWLNSDQSIRLYHNGNDYTVAPVRMGEVIYAPANSSSMFQGRGKKLSSLTFGNFDTRNVTDMSGMFAGCESLTSLDLSDFNTASVTDMKTMFLDCKYLPSLNVSNFNTDAVTKMGKMFKNCSSLKSLDLSSFNTSNVTDMNNMFNSCSQLNSLTIANFDMTNVSGTNYMFDGCTYPQVTLTVKALPYVKSGAFDSYFIGRGKSVIYQLDDNSVVYTGTNYLPAPTTAPTYTRTIAANRNWGTVVLPFALDSNDDVQFYSLSSVSAKSMTFSPVATVAANTPCVFKKKKGGATSMTFTANSVDAPAAAAIATPDAVCGLAIMGTYEKKENQTGVYYIAQDKVLYTEDPITIAPFRAWMTGPEPSSTNAFNIIIGEGGETTGISTVNNEESLMNNGKYLHNGNVIIIKNGVKYNANGQKVK